MTNESNKNQQQQNKSIEGQLKSIYQNQEGKLPNMSQLEQKRGLGRYKLLIGGLVLIAMAVAAAWIGFLWFPSGTSFVGTKVKIEIKAPFTIHSGEEVVYKISINNDEQTTLNDPKLTVRLPNGFRYKEASLAGVDENSINSGAQLYTYNLKDIYANSTSELDITGYLIGEIGNNPTISARLSYTPTGSAAQYEAAGNFTSEISETLTKLTATYQNQVTQDAPVTIDLTIKNLSETYPLENLKMSFDLPEDFKPTSLQAASTNIEYQSGVINTPEEIDKATELTYADLDQISAKTFEKENYLLLPGLAPTQEVTFRLTGMFEVSESGSRDITINLLAADTTNSFIPQSTEIAQFQVIKGEMLTTLILNGSTTAQTVNFDSPLTFLATIKNKSKSPIGGISIRVVIDSEIVDWKSLDDKAEGTTGSNQIIWGEKQVPQLKLMLPEDEIEIPFSLKTLTYAQVKDLNSSKYKVNAFFEVTLTSIDNVEVSKTIDSNTILASFNSNAQLTSQARYFDGAGGTIGAGPLPPMVGEKTTYSIQWQVDNTFHELNDLILTANLPDHVTWEFESTSEAGELTSKDGKIIWSINRLPISVSTIKASFKVSVTPAEGDLNKILSLLGETTLTATDKETGGSLNLTAQPLTTNLLADKNANGKSLVQPRQ